MYQWFNDFKGVIAKKTARICSSFTVNKESRNKKRLIYREKFKKWLDFQGPAKSAYNHRYIYHFQDGSDVILKKLQEGTPCLIARFGETELSTLWHFMNSKRYLVKYTDEIREKISNNAGFFPATDEKISRFCSELLLDVVQNIDILACWHIRGEEFVANKYCSQAKLVGMECTNPLIFQSPWTQYLKGKKVLVIHPFVETIKKQYQHRGHLFENPLMLPEFELKL